MSHLHHQQQQQQLPTLQQQYHQQMMTTSHPQLNRQNSLNFDPKTHAVNSISARHKIPDDNILNSGGSPALSASPPPAPPPLPPPAVRGLCQRCRLNSLSSRNELIGSTGHIHSGAMQHHHSHQSQTNSNNFGPIQQNNYTGYDGRSRLIEEDDSAYPALLERELHSLHRNVPALRRAGVDTNAIRQHFYPDGGYGWIVCGVAFLAHVLTTGFQLSYGLLLLYAVRHLGQDVATETGWLGAASWAMSLFSATIVIALCRRKSTRLTAVLGGLVLALGILFASFATQYHQVAFSYGAVVGVGASMVREASAVMIGHYFKRRRQFVEMIIMSGEGVGIALFSVILKEGVGKMGWRLGLQAVTGLVSFSFFMGLLYRSASLYHPQRRAILHLKNQRKKVKEKKTHIRTPKPPFLDFTPLRSSTVRMLAISTSIAALGIYTPIFFMSLHGHTAGYDMQDLVLLQTFIGLSLAIGIVTAGSSINKMCEISYRKIIISRQYVCQVCVILIALSMLVLSAVTSYRNLCLTAWTYGLGLGGYRYSLKMLALERIRGKHFSKAWGFIKGFESLPVLLGVPLAAFLNESSHRYGRAGYYVCSAAAAISAILMFFIGYPDGKHNTLSKYSANGSITSRCTAPTSQSECPHIYDRNFSLNRFNHWAHSPYTSIANGCTPNQYHYPQLYSQNSYNMNGNANSYHSPYCQSYASGGQGRLHKSLSFAFQTPMMMNESNLNLASHTGCSSANGGYPGRCYSRCELHNNHNSVKSYPMNGLQNHPSRSRSVPEGLGFASHGPEVHGGNHCRWTTPGGVHFCRPVRPIQVVEQITTSNDLQDAPLLQRIEIPSPSIRLPIRFGVSDNGTSSIHPEHGE